MTTTTVAAADAAVLTLLAAAGLDLVVEGSAGANLFLGDPRLNGAVPRAAVFVQVSGGHAPQAHLGASLSKSSWYARVQVRVRDEAHRRVQAEALARNIAISLHLATPTGYWRCVASQSEPIYLGAASGTGLHEYTVNFELSREE